jgi:hypothetical protein
MNVYELEKQTNVGLARSVFTLRTDAEARMRTHCRNHFLTAVNALQTIRTVQQAGHGIDEKWLDDVIDQLEDVT